MSSHTPYRLWRKLFSFLLVVLVINFVARWFYMNHVQTTHELYAQDQAFEENEEVIQYLIMGHSRAKAAISDHGFSTFNYASDGEQIMHTYYKLKAILEKDDHEIGSIVLPAGLGSHQTFKRNLSFETTYWGQYLNYVEIAQLTNDFEGNMSQWMQYHCFPYSTGFAKTVNEELGEPIQPFDKQQFALLSSDEKQANAHQMAFKNADVREVNSLVALYYLQQVLDLCAASKINIYFVKFPVTDYYQAAQINYLAAHPCNQNAFDDLLKRQPLPYKVLDFTDEFAQQYELFADAHHLNETGKKVFSELLWRHLPPSYPNPE